MSVSVAETKQINVVIVDDEKFVRGALRTYLSQTQDVVVVAEGENGQEAIDLVREHRPDVLIIDVQMPVMDGVAAIRHIVAEMPEIRILVVTGHVSDIYLKAALIAGASGYVVKDIRGMELAQAIKSVGSGKSLLDNRAAAALMTKLRNAAERSDPLSGLTDQERVLLDLLGEGLTNKQIAARMFLAEKTVKNYVSRLLAKLGMERRTQAAVFVSKLDRPRRSDD